MVSADDKLNRTATVTLEQVADAIVALEHCADMVGAEDTNLRYVSLVLTNLMNREIGSIKLKER